jgi:hypothetical protein
MLSELNHFQKSAVPLLSGRICCFVDPARPGLVISIQLKPTQSSNPHASPHLKHPTPQTIRMNPNQTKNQ